MKASLIQHYNKVSKCYSESATIDDFGDKMSLHRTDVEHLRSVFMAVENGDIGMLKSLGIRVSTQDSIVLNLISIFMTFSL